MLGLFKKATFTEQIRNCQLIREVDSTYNFTHNL